MPEPLTTYINLTKSWLETAAAYLSQTAYWIEKAGLDLVTAGHTLPGNDLTQAAGQLRLARNYFGYGLDDNFSKELYNSLHWLDLNSVPPTPVDMAAILNAMLASSFGQLQTFIGIEQAYMAAMWNAPYNGEYYAALARGWRQWQ